MHFMQFFYTIMYRKMRKIYWQKMKMSYSQPWLRYNHSKLCKNASAVCSDW